MAHRRLQLAVVVALAGFALAQASASRGIVYLNFPVDAHAIQLLFVVS
jgi:hypothetical protein